MFKKKGITLIKGKLNKDKFDIKLILKKLYNLGCRNLLVEGGNDLIKELLKKDYLMNFIYLKVQKVYQSWLT